MSIECTIDLQLSELGFPDLLQTSEAAAGETQCVSFTGSEQHAPVPNRPAVKQVAGQFQPLLLEAKSSSINYSAPPSSRVSIHAPPSRGSHHAPPSRGSHHATPSTGSNHAPTHPVSSRTLTHPGAAGVQGPPAAQTTEHLADGERSRPTSSRGVNEDRGTNKAAMSLEDDTESSEDSEVSSDESLDEDPNGEADGGTGDHRCAVCHLQLRSSAKLQDHMNLHTGQRPHCCAECGKRFCQLRNYRTHLKTHVQPKVPSALQCRVCRTKFRSAGRLRAHLTSTHFELEFFECDLCKMVFTDRTKCQRHVETHSYVLPRPGCETCGRRFHDKASLDRHHTKKCRLSFACTDCNRAFPRKNALLRHSFSHVGLRPFTCLQCNSHFRLAKLYLRHKCDPQRIHCVACLKVFPSEKAFRKHQKETGCWGQQEPKAGDEILCPECGKSFATREELKEHAGAHQRILTCDECGKGFRSALILMSHMGGHAAETPCLCQRCGRGFLHQTDYDRHLERCGLAPLPATVSKKRTQRSPAPPVPPTPLPAVAAHPPLPTAASTVSGPSPETVEAQGSCPPTGDKPNLVGVNIIMFVPINYPLVLQGGLPPAAAAPRPPSSAGETRLRPLAIADSSFDLHKSIMDQMKQHLVALTSEVKLPPIPVTNVNAAPLDLSKKVANLVEMPVANKPVGVTQAPVGAETVSMNRPADSCNAPPVSIKTEEVSMTIEEASIQSEAVGIKTEEVSIQIAAASPAHSVETQDCGFNVETKECWVVLRRWSGNTHDVRGDSRQ